MYFINPFVCEYYHILVSYLENFVKTEKGTAKLHKAFTKRCKGYELNFFTTSREMRSLYEFIFQCPGCQPFTKR